MTETDREQPEAAEEHAEPAESGGSEQGEPADEEESLPEIEADERATIDLSGLADRVEAEAGRGDDAAAVDEDTDDDGSVEPAGSSDESVESSGNSWGDAYVDILTVLLAAIADRHGTGDGIDTDELVDLATKPPVNLAENFDRMLEEAGRGTEIPPEKAVLFGSVALVAVVVIKETDLLDQGIERIVEELNL
jgi:hypothetical protein